MGAKSCLGPDARRPGGPRHEKRDNRPVAGLSASESERSGQLGRCIVDEPGFGVAAPPICGAAPDVPPVPT